MKKEECLKFIEDLGFKSYFPICLPEKRPIIKWKEFLSRSPTKSEVERWMRNPKINGFGLIPTSYIVLDIDSEAVYSQYFSDINTLTLKTPHGGYHLYFRQEKKQRRKVKFMGWDIDILADGGFFIIGEGYEIYKNFEILEIKDIEDLVFSRLPKPIYSIPAGFEEKMKEFKSKIDINQILSYYSIQTKKIGKNIMALCPFHNDTNPSMIVNRDNVYCFACQKAWDVVSLVKEKENTDFWGSIKKLEEISGIQFTEGEKKEIDNIEEMQGYILSLLIGGERKRARFQTAEFIMEKFFALKIVEKNRFYYYHDGIFIEDKGNKKIRGIIRRIWGSEATRHDIQEILAQIENKNSYSLSQFNPMGKIPLLNGVLDIERGEIQPFKNEPDEFFTFKVPVLFNPDADCPKIKKFVSEIVAEEDIPTIFELIGYCLYQSYPFHKAFMFVGEGDNGKSTLINLIKTFLGEENTASISLQELETNRFAKAQLHGKLANLFADLTQKSLRETGIFKMLTGSDVITTDQKWGDFLTFKNHAKLIFSANTLPRVFDDTNAFFRRWIIINFPRTFSQEDKDPFIIRKITTEEELSGLLNEALKGLKRLLERGDFTTKGTTDEWREKYIRLSDPIKSFVMDCLESDPESVIVYEDLYNEFVEYCTFNNLPVKSKIVFSREVGEHIRIEKCLKLTESGQKRAYRGVRIVDWRGKGEKNTEDEDTKCQECQVSLTYEEINQEHIKNSQNYLDIRDNLSKNAYNVQTQKNLPDSEEKPGQNAHNMYDTPRKKIREIQKIIYHYDIQKRGGLVLYDDIVLEAEKKGISEEEVKKILNELKMKGIIYEPRHNQFALV